MFGWLKKRRAVTDVPPGGISIDEFMEDLFDYAERLEWRDVERDLVRQIRTAEINGSDSSEIRAMLYRLRAMK